LTSGDQSAVEPPGPIPNPEVKRRSANGSETIGLVRVGRRQVYARLQAVKCSEPGSFFCPRGEILRRENQRGAKLQRISKGLRKNDQCDHKLIVTVISIYGFNAGRLGISIRHSYRLFVAHGELTEKLGTGQSSRSLAQVGPWNRIRNHVYNYQLRELDGRLKNARPSYLKKNEEAVNTLKVIIIEKMKELELSTDRMVKFWIYNEVRRELHPSLQRVWSLKRARVVCP
jgi:hypothetical protein